MHFHRTAERAARAVYGTIIALAVVATLEGSSTPAGEMIAAVAGAVIAAQLAELYAQYLASVMREQRHQAGELRRAAGDSAAGTLAAFVTVVPFVLAAAGAMELDTAFNIAFWAGLGVLATYTLLANRLAGLSGVRSAVAFGAVLAIGVALIALKALVH